MTRAAITGAAIDSDPRPSPAGDVLRVEGVSKSFAGVKVLDDVSLEVGRNQIVGIVGENGAGKTTLFNIISGLVRPDSGRIVLRGREIAPRDLRDANLLGISRVFQEQALIANIAVYENLLLSHEALFTRWGQLLDKRAMIDKARRICAAAGVEIDVTRRTGDYGFSKRQAIEIARAAMVPSEVLDIPDPVILLDEPTSSLQRSEEESFFRLLHRLREHGSILFVSHRLSEVLGHCDVIYVLKDGRCVARVDPAEADEQLLHGLMVGRERDADYYHENAQGEVADHAPVFRIAGLAKAGAYDAVDLDIHAGEILGIGGLAESGKSDLGRGAAGLMAPDAGTVQLGADPAGPPDLGALIARGLGYVPAERLVEGMIPALSVAWNISLASGGDLFSNRWGLWRSGLETAVAEDYIGRLSIRARGPAAACSTLSGGNQQKVVLARWLCRKPRLLILDNPTRGVDAGAKEEIYRLIRTLTADGVGIILITDELLELIGLSHRIAIMREGRISRLLPAPAHAKPTERELVALMLGSPETAPPAREHAGALPGALPGGLQ
jgi:ribose transport system ATP-binding protein